MAAMLLRRARAMCRKRPDSFRRAAASSFPGAAAAPQRHDPSRQNVDPLPHQGFEENVPDKLVLFQARWMQPLRLLVRLKIFQLAGFAAIATPIIQYADEGMVSGEAIAACLGITFGATGASLALWYYSRRYIGELSLVPPYPHYVEISTIDFWGNRENLRVPISKVDPPPFLNATPTDLKRMARDPFVPLSVTGKRQFCLALVHGRMYHRPLFFAFLSGSLDANNFEELLYKNEPTN